MPMKAADTRHVRYRGRVCSGRLRHVGVIAMWRHVWRTLYELRTPFNEYECSLYASVRQPQIVSWSQMCRT